MVDEAAEPKIRPDCRFAGEVLGWWVTTLPREELLWIWEGAGDIKKNIACVGTIVGADVGPVGQTPQKQPIPQLWKKAHEGARAGGTGQLDKHGMHAGAVGLGLTLFFWRPVPIITGRGRALIIIGSPLERRIEPSAPAFRALLRAAVMAAVLRVLPSEHDEIAIVNCTDTALSDPDTR